MIDRRLIRSRRLQPRWHGRRDVDRRRGRRHGGGSVTPGGCIICDDFESSTSLDAAKWVIDTSMGAAAGKAES